MKNQPELLFTVSLMSMPIRRRGDSISLSLLLSLYISGIFDPPESTYILSDSDSNSNSGSTSDSDSDDDDTEDDDISADMAYCGAKV